MGTDTNLHFVSGMGFLLSKGYLHSMLQCVFNPIAFVPHVLEVAVFVGACW